MDAAREYAGYRTLVQANSQKGTDHDMGSGAMDGLDNTRLGNYPEKCERMRRALKPKSRVVMAADV